VTVRFIPEKAKFIFMIILILLEVIFNERASRVDMQCALQFRCCDKLSIGDTRPRPRAEDV
ncbi:MAG: hypothetical protein WA764_23300, partial [Pseudolabrys sp.]